MDTGWPSASGMTTWGVRDGRLASGCREYGGGVAGSGKVDDGTEHLNAA